MEDDETLLLKLAALNFDDDEPQRNIRAEISTAPRLGKFDRTAPLHGLAVHSTQD